MDSVGQGYVPVTGYLVARQQAGESGLHVPLSHGIHASSMPDGATTSSSPDDGLRPPPRRLPGGQVARSPSAAASPSRPATRAPDGRCQAVLLHGQPSATRGGSGSHHLLSTI